MSQRYAALGGKNYLVVFSFRSYPFLKSVALERTCKHAQINGKQIREKGVNGHVRGFESHGR